MLRAVCTDSTNLPIVAGNLEGIEFWPRWSAEGIEGRQYIEPDVFMQFCNFDLIIEAKKGDDGGQYNEQWINQIRAYCNEMKDDRELFYITLGGNSDKLNDRVEVSYNTDEKIQKITTTINKCDWMSLLIEITTLKSQLKTVSTSISSHDAILRLLDDIIASFNYHGFYNVKWFKNLTYKSVNNESIETLSSLPNF
ncbi:MAG: hypothetical protein JEZ14_11350 [Marinilabiliaceae bacterium]|nr:hypothetical protein [Marinilabiliaceae bacterium]